MIGDRLWMQNEMDTRFFFFFRKNKKAFGWMFFTKLVCDVRMGTKVQMS